IGEPIGRAVLGSVVHHEMVKRYSSLLAKFRKTGFRVSQAITGKCVDRDFHAIPCFRATIMRASSQLTGPSSVIPGFSTVEKITPPQYTPRCPRSVIVSHRSQS